MSLLQSLIAGFYGDPVAAGYSYWGTRFWGGPSPYFLSLYLGGAVLCFVALGAAGTGRYRTRLLLLAAAGLIVCLGRWARLDVLLEIAPFLAKFRFPVKAFFTVAVATALLAGAGADHLLTSRRAWRALLVGRSSWAWGSCRCRSSRARGRRRSRGSRVASSWTAFRASCERRRCARSPPTPPRGPRRFWRSPGSRRSPCGGGSRSTPGSLAATAIIAADLLRAGAGLNPTAHASLYRFSPEATLVAARLRQAGGRVFTCAIHAMPTFREAVRRLPRSSVWAAAVWRETFSPYANMDAGLSTTGADPTALVSAQRSLSTGKRSAGIPGTLRRLRESGVRFILSVQPFTNEELRLVDVASPARTAPLSIYVLRAPGEPSRPERVARSRRPRRARARPRLPGATARYLDDPTGLRSRRRAVAARGSADPAPYQRRRLECDGQRRSPEC